MRFTLWNLLSTISLVSPPSVALNIAIQGSGGLVACTLAAIVGLLIGAVSIAAMRMAGASIGSRVEIVSSPHRRTIYNALILCAFVSLIVVSMIASDRVTVSILRLFASHST